MNRLTSFCGKWIRHSGWYPDRKLRLFDKTKGSFAGINPHDRFEMQPGATSGFLKGDLCIILLKQNRLTGRSCNAMPKLQLLNCTGIKNLPDG